MSHETDTEMLHDKLSLLLDDLVASQCQHDYGANFDLNFSPEALDGRGHALFRNNTCVHLEIPAPAEFSQKGNYDVITRWGVKTAENGQKKFYATTERVAPRVSDVPVPQLHPGAEQIVDAIEVFIARSNVTCHPVRELDEDKSRNARVAEVMNRTAVFLGVASLYGAELGIKISAEVLDTMPKKRLRDSRVVSNGMYFIYRLRGWL